MVEKNAKRYKIVEHTPSRLALHLNFHDGFFIGFPLMLGILFLILIGILLFLPNTSTFVWAFCVPFTALIWLLFAYAVFNRRLVEIDKESRTLRVENLHWFWRRQKIINIDQIRKITIKQEDLETGEGGWPVYRIRVKFGPEKRQEVVLFLTTTEFEALAITGIMEKFLRF